MAKMALPWTMLMVAKMQLRESCQFIDGLLYVQHRNILETKLPEFSVLLSPDSHLVHAIATSLHERFHDMDSRSFSSILKREDVPIHVPRLHSLLTTLEKSCITCRIKLSIPSFAREGALSKIKVSPVSHWNQATLNLAGPILLDHGHGKKKCWLGILVSSNSHQVKTL